MHLGSDTTFVFDLPDADTVEKQKENLKIFLTQNNPPPLVFNGGGGEVWFTQQFLVQCVISFS